MSAPLPRQIHRYEVLSELGRGSMGRVYLARDPLIGRRIALKVLIPGRLVGDDAEEVRQRFLREARAAGRLSHPAIVTVYDAATDPDTDCPYLAMEWVRGCSLKSLLRRDGRLPVARAVELAAQVARGLDYAHARGVVHRDVKPANLLVAGDRVKIVDFGIAKLTSRSVTLPGRVLGSPYYMAPEQVGGRAVDGRADLFALGSVLYEALTGRVPFPGKSVAAVTHEIVTAPPRPIRPAVPASLQAVVGRALAKLPADRYQTGAEMAAALETVGAELVLGSTPSRPHLSHRAGSSTRPLFGTTEIMDRPKPSAWRWTRPVILAALVAVGILIGSFPARLAAPEAELLAMDSRALDRAPPHPPPAPEDKAPELPSAATRAGRLESGPSAALSHTRPIARENAAAEAPGTAPVGQEIPGSGDARGAASLEIVHENRFRLANLSVWIDGEKALSVQLRTKNPLTRVAGREHRWTIPIAAGERTVSVLVTGASQQLEAWTEVSRAFAAGEHEQVRVEVRAGSRELGLAWSG